MILATKQMLIDNVAQNWRSQYFKPYLMGGHWSSVHSEMVYDQLTALKTPTVADIAAVIGNASWTRLKCDECDQEVDRAVYLGKIDYDGGVICVCPDCLRKALVLVEAAQS